jgi:hypothetical protein
MPEIDLTQKEANKPIVLPKKLITKTSQKIKMPLHSGSIIISGKSIGKKKNLL